MLSKNNTELTCDACGRTVKIKHPDNVDMEIIARGWDSELGKHFCSIPCKISHKNALNTQVGVGHQETNKN